MKIKSASPCGVKYSFVPCGKCSECRKSYQNAWFFRLAAELQCAQKKGWHIGFFTLTYSDEHLPVFVTGEGSEVRCFRRSDVRRLILRLRKQYHKKFGVTDMVYLIASELGEHTKRSHYHGIIAFPPIISPGMMLHDIKRYWSDENFNSLGFVFPSFEEYANEKFICKSAYGAALYASKYCCKDIAFLEEISAMTEDDFASDSWKNCKQFHIQSKSLGISLLQDMSDEDKYCLYTKGLQFVGSDSFVPAPLYIKNKILFDPKYITDSEGNRLVRREASSFMKKYADDIYSKKVDFYEGLFNNWNNLDFWSKYGFDSDIKQSCVKLTSLLLDYFGSARGFAEYFVSYFGVPYYARTDNPVSSWLARYEDCWFEDKSSFQLDDLDDTIDLLFSYVRLDKTKELKYEKMKNLNLILDFHKNNNLTS